jgi:hypothetical protein
MAIIKNKTGKISLLRVHEKGTGFGADNDYLDAEVIVRFDNDAPRCYGFQLRNDDKLPAAQAMFALLQDAFNANASVSIDYDEVPGGNNHRLFRVWRTA